MELLPKRRARGARRVVSWSAPRRSWSSYALSPTRARDDLASAGHAVGMVEIRAAHVGDEPRLREIERLAGAQFRSVGLDAVADDEPASVAELRAYAEDGRSWVAVDDGE